MKGKRIELTIMETDIKSALCQRCGECCRIRLPVDSTPRYRKYLRAIGLNVEPKPKDGEDDCCGETHKIKVDLGYCQHLEVSHKGTRFRCRIHEQRNYPQLCREYNCVSWAKATGTYESGNELMVRVQELLKTLPPSDSANARPTRGAPANRTTRRG